MNAVRLNRARWVPMTVAGLLVAGCRAEESRPAPQPPPSVVASDLSTTYHAVRRTDYLHHATNSTATGGGLSLLNEGYLLATGDGDLYALAWRGDSLRVDTLPWRVPMNAETYRAEAGVRTQWFRVADVLAQVAGGRVRIFVTHHHWNSDQRCFVLRLSALETAYPLAPAAAAWRTVYDTRPCLTLKGRGHPFAGIQSGGRLAFLDQDQVLLTVGDHQYDGVFAEEQVPQDPAVDYGKTLLVSVSRGTARHFTSGHRNQQGLLVEPDGTIWLTEHGPKGGDELNRLRDGANYGWPLATYGTEYASTRWPVSLQHGEHEGFEPPFFSWVPSIGVSGLVRVAGRRFGSWRGDLLISTLLAENLYRMRIRNDRVAYVEAIALGKRVRDLEEGPDGRIVLWTEDGVIVSLVPDTTGDVALAAYGTCAGCHRLGDGTRHGAGPDLFGITGRDIASRDAFPYSEALRRLDGTWTDDRLDAFLASPAEFAPGTSMAFEGIPDPATRATLIAYLKTVR